MAGKGPAPKAPEDRRRRNQPAAGEWVDLPPLAKAVLPPLPAKRPAWSARTRAAWKSWRADPVTAQYGPADVQLALDLAYLYEQWVREPAVSAAGEIRQRLDTLGLSPKGRQDRRWRLQPAAEVVPIADAAPARKSARERMEELRKRAPAGGGVA